VMPGTAVEIATALGDEAFFAIPPGAREEYLKDPKVSYRYGKFYLNQQLQRYGGDVELALVAYNAGPGVADRYKASGRNPNVLPDETKNYVKSIASKIGGLTPDMAYDPEHNLTLDQAMAAEADILSIGAQAARDGENWITVQNKALQDRDDQVLQAIYAAGESGQNAIKLYQQALETGQLSRYSQEDYSQARTITERVLKTEIETQEALTRASAGLPVTAAQGDMIMGPEVQQADDATASLLVERG
jgi:hypothetical protein